MLPASPSDAMGEATFSSELMGPSHVRAITLDEVKATAKKLRGIEAARFDALLSLRDALESADQLARNRALDSLERVYRLRETEAPKMGDSDPILQLGGIFASGAGLTAEEAAKYMQGMRSGPKAAKDVHRLFSYEVSQAVGSLFQAEIVLWWMDGAFRPAIYCPDTKTALYIHTFFLAPNGEVGFRNCPYDGKPFFQNRPNQEYCCPAHREAHRVARFRDNKRRKNEERGKHHGTHKAR